MSKNQSDPRVTQLMGEVQRLRQDVNQLEADMARTADAVIESAKLLARKLDEVRSSVDAKGDEVVSRIDSTNTQLVAANAGIIATNGSILLHKHATEKQFAKTKALISKQTSAVVQMECIRAYNEAVALRSKALAFAEEIDDQFDKAVEGVFINRVLYDKHFQSIHEEYDLKVRTIGEHIFAIWENDLRPAEQCAQVPHSAFQQLALDVDLERLARRSAQLDQDLEVVFERSLEPRLDMDRSFERALSSIYGQPVPAIDGTRAAVAAIFLSGAAGPRVVMDRVAQPAGISSGEPAPPTRFDGVMPPPLPPVPPPDAGVEVGTSVPPPIPPSPPLELPHPTSLAPEVSTRAAVLHTDQAAATAAETFVQRVAQNARRRPMNEAEMSALWSAIGRLADRGLVPADLLPGFDTYIKKVPLQILEQQEVAV